MVWREREREIAPSRSQMSRPADSFLGDLQEHPQSGQPHHVLSRGFFKRYAPALFDSVDRLTDRRAEPVHLCHVERYHEHGWQV